MSFRIGVHNANAVVREPARRRTRLRRNDARGADVQQPVDHVLDHPPRLRARVSRAADADEALAVAERFRLDLDVRARLLLEEANVLAAAADDEADFLVRHAQGRSIQSEVGVEFKGVS